MRKLMVAAALASTAFATPAVARDGAPYVGIDAGLLKPSNLKLRLTNSAGSIDNAINIHHIIGIDADVVIGYDFGMFRLEGELGYKHAKLNRATISRSALNSYQGTLLGTELTADGNSRALSGMINALFDFGPSEGVNASLGAGAGGARIRYTAGFTPTSVLNFTTSNETTFAWQLLAEVRAPVSNNVDVGIKYRYFEAPNLTFGRFCVTTCGPLLPYDLHGRYRTMSLMGSLTYNFWSPPPPPPPPPPPLPPPPPPLATQTCPDGSVILATDTCPAPPPPPPPPPPAPERG